MKKFSCGDVVPGCSASFEARTDDELLGLVAAHARSDHGLDKIEPELEKAVRAKIVEAS